VVLEIFLPKSLKSANLSSSYDR